MDLYPEPQQNHLEAQRRAVRREGGAGTDSLRYGVLAYSPEWERRILALPDYPGMPVAQYNDGSFPFLVDYDAVDAGPVA